MTRSARIWGERILAGVGIALLCAFFLVRAGQADDRDAGIAAFHAVHTNAPATSRTSSIPVDTAAPRSPRSLDDSRRPDHLPGDAPDQTHWSDIRIQAYEESLQAVEEVPLALLRLDRLGIEVPVYNGTEHPNLDRGAGRIRGTGWIHGPGNLGIAAHRDGFFRPLKDVETGDILHLVTPSGVMEYSVESTTIVSPDDVSVLAPSEDRVITLVTCYPFYFVGNAPERFIVTARAVEDLPTNDEGTT